MEEFELFTKKYKCKSTGPDWDIIRNDYDAVSFEFCKLYCLYNNNEFAFKSKYSWHLSYDVESMMIFNKKMFNYKVIDVTL